MEIGSGKVAVVTGGASGIGFAMATRFLEQGMAVAIADVQEDALSEAVDRLGAGGGRVLGVPTDVSDHEQVVALRDRVLAELGGAHVLCNNAGVAAGGLLWETSPHDWDWILGVNLLGVVYGIQAFVPHLIEQGEGHVVNTASMAGLTSPPAMGPYNATKHGVVTISETLYGELHLMTGGAVGVSVLCPGWVRTNISRSDRNRPDALTDGSGALDGLDSPQRQVLEGLISGGMDPLEVADIVLEGIAQDRFYLFTNDLWNVMVKDRAERVMGGENPRVGLPPGVDLSEG
jgi:NAD(P)-dependent dehydrogenase (short-subunit alcohol dehydrogenase family)